MSEIVSFPNRTVEDLVLKIVKKLNISDYDIQLSHATNKGQNFLGLILRVRVIGTKYGRRGEYSLIVKTAPSDFQRERIPVDMFYSTEQFAYSVILPHFEKMQLECRVSQSERFECVKHFGGDMTPMNEVIVLEDMGVFGYTTADKFKSLSIEEMKLVVSNLSMLHALSFALRTKDADRFEHFARRFSRLTMKESARALFDMCCDKAMAFLEDEECKEKLMKFKEGMWQNFTRLSTPYDKEPYTVICHGDCWVNNVLFKYENGEPIEIRLVDWQMLKHTSPITDLAFLMFTSTDEQFRRNHYEELLDFYYDRLKNNLTRLGCDIDICYPENIFRNQIKSEMPFGLIMALFTAPMYMCDGDEVSNFENAMRDDFKIEFVLDLKEESARRYKERICGVVKDFVRLGLI